MEQYPSIGVKATPSIEIFAFDKLDGSNIRVEWSKKNGFSKFGSRTRLIDATSEPLGESIELFLKKYADDLEQIYQKSRYERATAFLEFHGVNSFAGYHEKEPHDVTLFDVHIYKRGMLPPKEFISVFADKVETPKLLYRGKPNAEFISKVRKSTLSGMTFEGVVCKSAPVKNRSLNFKIKSEAWLNKLKGKYGADSEMFNKLK